MKVSILLSIHNRSDLLTKGLDSLMQQSMNRNDFEVILIDDNSSEDLSKVYSQYPLNIVHIKFDPKEHPHYRGYHTPALSLNLGIKQAIGTVLCFSQPEVIHFKENLTRGYTQAIGDTFVFGTIMLSHRQFTKDITSRGVNPDFALAWEHAAQHGNMLPGDPRDDNADKGLYWFVAFLRRDHALAVGGVDETYMEGVYGEDDDFRDRIRLSGINSEHAATIRGIHINHDHEEDLYVKQDRNGSFWTKGAEHNRARYRNFCSRIQQGNPVDIVANADLTWGDEKYIVEVTKQQAS